MKEPRSAFYFEPLGGHDRSQFSCGSEPLDRYLKEQASQDARKRAAAPFVLVETESKRIAGYYTLSATNINVDDLTPQLVKRLKLPRYPRLPATLIGRLARDVNFPGQRLGELLLLDALSRASRTSREIASTAVIVDAKDERAIAFYRSFAFLTFPEIENRLFLPMQSIEILLAGRTKDQRPPETSMKAPVT